MGVPLRPMHSLVVVSAEEVPLPFPMPEDSHVILSSEWSMSMDFELVAYFRPNTPLYVNVPMHRAPSATCAPTTANRLWEPKPFQRPWT